MKKHVKTCLALLLSTLLALSATVSALAGVVEVRSYAELAQAAANNATAIKILQSIQFGAGDNAVQFNNSVTITADDGCTLSRDTSDPSNIGQLIVLNGPADPSYQNTLTLENLTFSGGSSTGNGGAVYVDGNAELTNCTFDANAAQIAGGGLYVSGDATLTDTTFTNNMAGDSGGGAYLDSDATFEGDTTFEGNYAKAGYGGGVAVMGDATFGESTTFEANSAESSGGGAYLDSNATFEGNVIFEGNVTQSGEGGGATIAGDAIFNGDSTTFRNNAATVAGGILACGEATFDGDAAFEGNYAQVAGGGGVFAGTTTFNGDSTTFTGNDAYSCGGGAFFTTDATFGGDATFTDNTAGMYGGGIFHGSFVNPDENDPGTLTFNDATFANNTSTDLGGAITSFGDVIINGEAQLEGNTAEGNQGHGIQARSLTVNETNNESNNGNNNGNPGNAGEEEVPDYRDDEPEPEPTPEPEPQPTHPSYRGITFSAQWLWQLYLGDASRDFRIHALEANGDLPVKGEKYRFRSALSAGPDGNIQLSLSAYRSVDTPVMIALSPYDLHKLVKLGITTIALLVPKTGETQVYSTPDLLAALESAGLADVQEIWLTGSEDGFSAVDAQGQVTLITLGSAS